MPSPEQRAAARLERQAQRVRYDAMVSGAMPNEFRVVHVYKARPIRGIATELR